MAGVSGLSGAGPVDDAGATDTPATDAPAEVASVVIRESTLPARMAVAASITSPQPQPAPGTSADIFKQRMTGALPPPPPEATDVFQRVVDGPLTGHNTSKILDALDKMSPDDWLATLDRLSKLPWRDKNNLSMFDKLLSHGIGAQNSTLARFADQAIRKLGLPLETIADRVAAHAGDKKGPLDFLGPGVARRRAERRADDDVRGEAADLFKYLDVKESAGAQGALRFVAEGAKEAGLITAEVALSPVLIPIWLLTQRKP